jgi:predicted RNase H-like HicB family nuclease
MTFTIESEQESDGRWLAEVIELPGVMAYGPLRIDAIQHAKALALRVIAERIENGEPVLDMSNVFTVLS